jgi:hypothetical protein
LRLDIQKRFFPITISPLYLRRLDVLYYLGFKFPELVPHLSPIEVLALLAYNWPGNVREVERIGRLLLRERELWKTPSVQWERRNYGDSDFLSFNRRDTALDISQAIDLARKLRNRSRKNYELLQQKLQPFGLGLGIEDNDEEALPFKQFRREYIIDRSSKGLEMGDFIQHPEGMDNALEERLERMEEVDGQELIERFGFRVLKTYEPFNEIWRGLLTYCYYFFQSHDENKDLLDTSTGSPYAPLIDWSDDGKASMESQVLKKDIFEILANVDLYRYSEDIPDDYKERTQFISSLRKVNSLNIFLESLIDDQFLPSEPAEPPAPKTYYLKELLRESPEHKDDFHEPIICNVHQECLPGVGTPEKVEEHAPTAPTWIFRPGKDQFGKVEGWLIGKEGSKHSFNSKLKGLDRTHRLLESWSAKKKPAFVENMDGKNRSSLIRSWERALSLLTGAAAGDPDLAQITAHLKKYVCFGKRSYYKPGEDVINWVLK